MTKKANRRITNLLQLDFEAELQGRPCDAAHAEPHSDYFLETIPASSEPAMTITKKKNKALKSMLVLAN